MPSRVNGNINQKLKGAKCPKSLDTMLFPLYQHNCLLDIIKDIIKHGATGQTQVEGCLFFRELNEYKSKMVIADIHSSGDHHFLLFVQNKRKVSC